MAHEFPQRFGRYTLLRPLGFGGMGLVYLALVGEPGLETVCVVKRVQPALLAKSGGLQQFMHEADLARRLVHGNLVHTHAVESIDGEVVLVQEFVEGQDLSALMDKLSAQERRLPLAAVLYVAASIARALEYAHKFENLELVHRDINPPNVRLSYDGEVKLLDFGIASSKLQVDEAAKKNGGGKLAYMAPEQFGGGELDGRTDLFALGAILWEMLTGYALGTRKDGENIVYPDGGREDLISRMVRAEFDRPSVLNPEVAPALDGLVLSLLEKDVSRRPRDAATIRSALLRLIPPGYNAEQSLAREMNRLFNRDMERADREALMTLARRLPPSGVPATRHTATQPVVPRNRRLVAGAALVGVALIGGTSALMLGGTRSPGHGPVTSAPGGAASSTQLPGSEAAPAREPVASSPPPSTIAQVGVPTPPSPAPPATRPPPRSVASRAARPGGSQLTLARSAFNERDLPRALELAQMAVREQDSADARSLLGSIYFKLARLPDAEREFAAAARLDPADTIVQQRLRLVRRMLAGDSAGETGNSP